MKKKTSITELEKVAGNDKALLKELISKFISQTEAQLELLKKNKTSFEANEVKIVAHKMKSPFHYFGMHEQKLLAQKIEDSAQNDFELTKLMIDEIVSSCSMAMEELKETLNSIK